MAEEMTVTDTWVTGVSATDHLLDGIGAPLEAECHRQGTGGGAEAHHAVLSTEEGEVGTTRVLYGAVHPPPGKGHLAIVHDYLKTSNLSLVYAHAEHVARLQLNYHWWNLDVISCFCHLNNLSPCILTPGTSKTVFNDGLKYSA
ncbi:hypothetical protein Zm00014a_011794 [Zea mays]|uniref:Uncharacterized protein n=1 Tax=Zea mays TaxID=4577 RepID=A0A3L6F2I8_MAIZE|nr:hypothetical protein Zm00014a_011794 [Zea mays]